MGMAAAKMPRLSFASYGAVIAVHADDPALLALAAGDLPVGAAPCAADAPPSAVYRWRLLVGRGGAPRHVVTVRCSRRGGVHTVVRTDTPTEAARHLRHDAEFRVALHAPDRLFLHAAAVAWQGRAIVIPGHSHAGKSTLTAALLRAGAGYLSDEYAVLDAEGLVHPFARPLHMRPRTAGASCEVPAAAYGGATVSEPLPVGLVVSTTFREGAAWRPRPMSRGEVALTLLARAVVARVRPAYVLAHVAAAARGDVLGLHGRRGEADEAAARILARASRAFDGAPGS